MPITTEEVSPTDFTFFHQKARSDNFNTLQAYLGFSIPLGTFLRCQDLLESLVLSHQHIFILSLVKQLVDLLPQSTKLLPHQMKFQYFTGLFPLYPLSLRVKDAAITKHTQNLLNLSKDHRSKLGFLPN